MTGAKLRAISTVAVSCLFVLALVELPGCGDLTGISAASLGASTTLAVKSIATTSTMTPTTATESTSTTVVTTTTTTTAVSTTTTVAETTTTESGGLTVYITATGKKYHLGSCRYLKESKIPISLSDAKAQGYTPCKVCDPPQ
jgi:hypothetical protein